MKKQVFSSNSYKIEALNANSINLSELANFIVMENYKHHVATCFEESREITNIETEIRDVYLEERVYLNYSNYYIARNEENKMIGAIRLMKWDTNCELPIQKIFGINPLNTIESLNKYSTIWHIGRFAVSNSQKVSSLSLFKQLMLCALAPIYENDSDIIIAECDSKLIRTLSALGIKFNIMGQSIHYLGSETIPVYLTRSGIVYFFEKYRDLVTPTLLPQAKRAQQAYV